MAVFTQTHYPPESWAKGSEGVENRRRDESRDQVRPLLRRNRRTLDYRSSRHPVQRRCRLRLRQLWTARLRFARTFVCNMWSDILHAMRPRLPSRHANSSRCLVIRATSAQSSESGRKSQLQKRRSTLQQRMAMLNQARVATTRVKPEEDVGSSCHVITAKAARARLPTVVPAASAATSTSARLSE